ncbi:MAG: metallophosphoesterase [Chitinophagaceae bacterium]|nr:metallophosphoesterase [Chitinophagaceae bacterium]
MRSSGFMWLLVLILLILDTYIFQAVKMVSQQSSPKAKIIIYSLYWVLSIVTILMLILLPYIGYENWNKSFRNYVFAIIIGLFFAKMVTSFFLLIDDVRRAMTWIVTCLTGNPGIESPHTDSGISRSAFLSWLGIAAGGGIFGILLYGFSNKYRYQVKRVKLAYNNLPAAFKNLKIVQVSDIHSGSFTNKEAVLKGIQKIMDQKPDLILFTGDLVNDKASEMKDYMDVFSRLTAPLGVYSVLGNHDYGDYVKWESSAAKAENLEALKGIHKALGWRLLMNEHVSLERGNDKIALLGIENWGAKGRFTKYGKMTEAYPGSEQYPFKILLSHDPSHWDAEVRTNYPDIDLMLSGHTHGMQFGFEIPGFKWSPVQYMYKQWGGLYEEDKQKLYVNRGFGFIGYPGRVGILPEITLIELV